MNARKIVYPFKAAGGDFVIRIDLLEIAAYLPKDLVNGMEAENSGTVIILHNGETLAVQENPDSIDAMFAKNNLSFS